MEIGIIGLPNVGKSTLFNALTGAAIAAENFPFTTIEPNVGIVPLPDPRLGLIQEKYQSAKAVPAGIRFVDIAGLVKGASQGEGLGNKFLSHIRSVDALTHVIRFFKDENVANVAADLDPMGAIDIIETELMLADMQQAQKAAEKYSKVAKSGDKDARARTEFLERMIQGLNAGQTVRSQNPPEKFAAEFQFLTAKPVLYVANTDEGAVGEESLRPLRERAQREGSQVVVLCSKLEAEILELPPEDRDSYYKEAGIQKSGLELLAQAGKDLLELVCFFTANETEARARLIPAGTTAQKAAGRIHTDMEKGFIRAEVIRHDDLEKLGSMQAVQQKGLAASEGKEYEVKEGDIIFFRFQP